MVLEIFMPIPSPRMASRAHCFGAGVKLPGRSERNPQHIAIIILATNRTGKMLFLLNERPPPSAQPAAAPPIMGSNSAPALTGP